MKFEQSKYFKTIKHFKLVMPWGNYYLYEKFVVSELKQGVHFDWDKTKLLVKELIEFYGENAEIGFISNRVNAYSIDPQNWVKVEKEYNLLIASAIVIYNPSTYLNATLEKHFSKSSMKRCNSLDEAIIWIMSLSELN